MHFTVVYFKENVTLKDLKSKYLDIKDQLSEEFYTKYSDGCGERKPDIYDVCDWFQIGGRWNDMLRATKGYKGKASIFDLNKSTESNAFSIVNSADLEEEFLNKIDSCFAGVATELEYFEEGDPKFINFFTKLKNKEINGVLCLMDCHY